MAVVVAAGLLAAACRSAEPAQRAYLYVWAGDSAGQASDFLAVIDATPSSATYGHVVESRPTGTAGTHPHHTEAELGRNRHLLVNGFHAGRTWLYDLTVADAPTIIASFDTVAGFSHPHTFVRLEDGTVLATFQYRADGVAAAPVHAPHDAPGTRQKRETGGLVHMDERGRPIRSRSALDPRIADRQIYPYAVLPIAALDRALSSTTDMDATNAQATSEWVQLWRLSDLTLLRSIALAPGPRGDEHQFTGEPRLLPDGRSVYIHTFNCGLYLVRGIELDQPVGRFLRSFEGTNCGVPVLTGRHWIQTVPDAHALVVLDISDPERPREVSALNLGEDEKPHWVAIDSSGRRLVVNSADASGGNRVFVVDLDPATGVLRIDDRFRDAGSTRAGVRFTRRSWPHGFVGTAVPHGSVFSR